MAKFNPNRENFVTLENAFKILKENDRSKSGIDMLKTASEKIFPYKFNIVMIDVYNNSPLFVMSVFPEQSVLDKIVNAVAKSDTKVISKIWAETKNWTIEIDRRILKDEYIRLTETELTAIYCHEIGHISSSNSIPSRIVNILQYELAKTKLTNKVFIQDTFFSKLLSLPILNACSMEKNDSIKEEIKADKFAKAAGYQKDLISVMQKFQKCSQFKKDNPDAEMKKMAMFTTDALDQFKKRETSLLESTLLRMKEECNSVYLENALEEIINEFFYDDPTTSVTKEKRLNFFYERADRLTDEFIATEFFNLGRKGLKPIDPSELDYILIKMKSIETNDDKMMLVSYAHSKLDIVEYYISLLNNPKMNKKYSVPYTMSELESLRTRLKTMIDQIINYKLPPKLNGVLVAWPDGYEG